MLVERAGLTAGQPAGSPTSAGYESSVPRVRHGGFPDYRRIVDAITSRNRWRALRRAAPWVAIAVLISATQAVRGQWGAAALFLVVAVVLGVDATRRPSRRHSHRQHSHRRHSHWRPTRLMVAVVVLTAAVVLALAPRYSTLMGVGLVAVGLVALPFAWTGPDPESAGSRGREPATRRAVFAWAATLVVACLCELAAFVYGRIVPERSADFPSISMAVDPFLHQPWPRAVFIVGWLALGLLLVRPSAHRSAAAAGRGQAVDDLHPSGRAGDR